MAHNYRDIPSAGTKLQVDLGSGYVDVKGATDITRDGYSRAVRNPTHLMSTAVAKRPGMPNLGQIKCKVFYDPNDTVHKALRDRVRESAAVAYADADTFKLIYGGDGFATSAFEEYEGFVSEFAPGAADPETGTVTADMTIELEEVISFSDGSPTE